jgi:hypothetical protein
MAAFMPLVPQASSPHQLAADLHVVIFHEDDVLPQIGIAGKLHDLADITLTGLVLGMRLAGDHDLHRHLLVQKDALQALHVAE